MTRTGTSSFLSPRRLAILAVVLLLAAASAWAALLFSCAAPEEPGRTGASREYRYAAGKDVVSTPQPAALRVLRIRAVGDVAFLDEQPWPPRPVLPPRFLPASITALLREADLAFANLEGPLTAAGEVRKAEAPGRAYSFRMTPDRVSLLADAGLNMMSLANNHINDYGPAKVLETERLLHAASIHTSGRPSTFASVERRGLKVAMAAFAPYPYTNDLLDIPGAAAFIRRLKASHDLVLVSFHGGAEGADALRTPLGEERFQGERRGDCRAFARAVVDAGADLVLGHGPHVPRGLELRRGRLIAYSLGNFATWGRISVAGPAGLGLILEADLAADGRLLRGRIVPTAQASKGVPEIDPKGRAVALVKRLSEEDFPGTCPIVSADGSFSAK